MRASRGICAALVAAAVLTFGTAHGWAHRLDEYLQAARIDVAPSAIGLGLALTPGTAVAKTVIADIDRDGDGEMTATERAAYVVRVLRDVSLIVDHRDLNLVIMSAEFPDLGALRRGEGTIDLQARAELPNVEGHHRLSFRNDHRRDISVYLANALVPESPLVSIGAQHHAPDQHSLTLDYTVRH